MRQLFALICLLLLGYVSSIAYMNPYIAGGTGDECTGYLVCQNHEGTGYDNDESWTESNVVNEDYATAPAPFRGSYSVYLTDDGTDSYNYLDFTATDPVYVFARFAAKACDTAFHEVMKLKDSSNNVLLVRCKEVSSNPTFDIVHGSVASGSQASGYSYDTEYCFWFDYESGSGADGTANLYISTPSGGDCTKPAATLSIANGDGTTTAQRYYNLCINVDDTIIVDQILVSPNAIGNISG